MIKRIFLILCLLVALSTPANAEPEKKEKDHRIAVLLELFIPMAGNIYVDNTARGIIPNLLAFTGVSFLVVRGFDSFTYAFTDGIQGAPMSQREVNIYLTMGVIGKVWSVTECFLGATRYNKKLHALKPVVLPTNDGLAYGIQIKF
tara:strand:+ start:17987 stop:18424 length:438 start_codon:yes stop_codon:yes gene_type:complete